MTNTSPQAHRIAVLGLGAIGKRVLNKLQQDLCPAGTYAAFDRSTATTDPCSPAVAPFTDIDQLLAWRPSLAIECAGHAAVSAIVPRLLVQGTDVILVSIGALSDDELRTRLQAASTQGGGRLITVAGAIGGLDALDAARSAGLASVVYIGRKPPGAWTGTPAEQTFDLASLREPTEIFSGTARASAQLFPKNANVTAAVALAGVGFDRTQVRLIADPQVQSNVHELKAEGAFGAFQIRLENNPLPDNPKTSWLAALSIEAELRRYFRR